MARRRTTQVTIVGVADPREVAAWADDLSDAYLQCRDMGHTWRPFTARFNQEENCYDRSLRCGRCKAERKQQISLSGLVLSGHYDYPEGYTAPAGTGRLDADGRGALRLESTLRVLGKDEKD